MAALLILAVFIIFAALMYSRVLPALLAIPAMAVLMAFAADVPATGVAAIVVNGAGALAQVYVAVIFGAMLGRVTLDTGIARSIVNFAAEFGGEYPPAVALVLSAVVALLFVSLSGLGAVIMVGSIVLPIMMTTGVPRKIAATLFLMAFALGFIFNIVNWKFYTQYFGVNPQHLYPYAVVLAAIDACALVIYTIVSFSRSRAYATWAVQTEERVQSVPWYSLITPVLPIVLYFVLHLDPILAFAISAIYGALTARPRRLVQTLVAAAIRGVEDVAPAIVLFVGIGMLLTAAKQPQFASAMQPLAAWAGLRNPVVFVAIFGLLSPLTLYRGPLNPLGVGIAVFTVLLTAHVLPPVVLVAAVMAVVQVQNVCDPTNTQNVWIANYTGVDIEEITKRTLPYQASVATAGCLAVVLATHALLGVHAFVSYLPRAQAAALWSGLFVNARGADRIAVGSDGSSIARSEVGNVSALLNAGPVHAFALQTDPDAQDCSAKSYAAYAQMTSTQFALVEGTDVDLGLRLYDCGGWEVNEWHEHQVFARPVQTNYDVLTQRTVARLMDWQQSEPQRWQHLMSQGVAYAAGDPATYFYAFFKTIDGNMRAYVRAGGPAYAAGMRTGDLVQQIDGRFWWEYGTFQAQARAYDGRPHAFQIERAGKTLTVQLEEPFQP